MSHSVDYVNKEKNIILIWSPKVACTTLHKWFIEDICQISLYKDPRLIARERKINYHIFDYSPYRNFNSYFFIRDPIKRCISCYINKFVRYYDGRLLNSLKELEPFSIELIKNYDPKILENYKGITFNEYLSAIQYGMNIGKINHHFNNQIDISKIDNLKKNTNLKIINIEHLQEELNKINYNFNIPYKIYQKNNRSLYQYSYCFVDVTNTKSNNLSEENINSKNFYNSFQRIIDIYKDDYINLGQFF